MMSKQKTLIIAVIVLIIISIAGLIVSTNKPESENSKIYINALTQYNNNNNFSDAYYAFSKVSRTSKLKPVAIYRQALCAEKLGDKKSEIKKYKEVSTHYPNSVLAIRAKYNKAQVFYEDANYKNAKKEFKDISNKYPQTDYAIAAQYYLGSINAEKAKTTKNKKKKKKIQNTAIQYFKAYLKSAPRGRFALNCVQKWGNFNPKLTNEDNLIIAKVYMENEDYKNAKKYLNSTNLSVSWPYFVKTAYAMKDYSKVKYYTQQGIKGKNSDEVLINESNDEKSELQNIYEAIDLYLKVSDSTKLAISYLLSLSDGAKGDDYLRYKNCTNMPVAYQTACFKTLYYKYPQGQFSADALANIFYDQIKSKKYYSAKKIGRMHLSKYPKSKSAPKVMFWLAKINERTKNYEEARSYYKTLMRQFPDDYYAYHSFLNMNRFRHFNALNLEQKPVEFPYKDSSSALITKLAEVKDYGLINQLYKDDEFVQSWLAYLEGDISTSARLARDAMEKLNTKPPRTDLRWRLVYPIHYYKEIEQGVENYNNDPILILSIIREESYFNPKIKSAVGATGLMQLMPATANEAARAIGFSLPNNNLLQDPDINIKLGNVYYSSLKRALMNKDVFAVLAYNGGIGSVSRWEENLKYVDVDDFVEQIPYPETENYLKKVFRSYWNYLRIYTDIRF